MKQLFLVFLFIYVIFIANAIQVSSNQSGNWITDNNPYEIIGDVTVPSGLTLNIMPGVIIQAMGNYQIIAEGNIIAVGTETDSIQFVSGQADPNALWKGIRLESTTVQSQFSYCLVELGQYGINSINSPAEITYCRFNRNQKGIQAYGIGSANPADVMIDNNMVEWSIQNGILVAQNGNTTITNNEITRNGTSASYYGAIQLSNQSAGGSNNPEIAYNHIHHNFKQGITAWDIVSANAINPEIHHNLIENNLTGIYLRHSSGYVHHNTVINNFIPGDMNSGAGIMVSGGTSEPYFEDNIITGNFTGFYLTENANPVLGDLSIYHAWAQGGNTIANNIDALNVMHSIVCYSYTAGNFTVKAENNFWDYNTSTGIDSTITDFYDNASFPIIDYDPWQNNAIPIYLAGTVTMANPPVPTATLELVSVDTGLVLNTWTVNINEAFSVPVYHDSLVYIVAHATDLIENQYYGAYGGTDNPASTQIVADVQYNVGDVILTTYPEWNYYKVGLSQNINGHLTYPVNKGWFVYNPTETFWLFRDGDFLRITRYSTQNNLGLINDYNIPTTPIWRKIGATDTLTAWYEFLRYSVQHQTAIGDTVHLTADNITTFYHGQASQYDCINRSGELYLFDHFINRWYILWDSGYVCITDKFEETPILVEQDGTYFPLVEDNYWRITPVEIQTAPTYFGYSISDVLTFKWIPPGGSPDWSHYHVYDNGILVSSTQRWFPYTSITIPTDGLQHTYSLSTFNSTTNQDFAFCENPIVLTFTANQDEVLPVNKLLVYPNPFNPAVSELKVKYDFSKSANTKVTVYNLKGQLVWNAYVDKSSSEMSWNGRDNQGRICASGLYQLRLTDNKGKRITRKLMLIH